MRKILRSGVVVAALAMLALPAAAQQQQQQQRPGAARRAELERRVLDEFMERAGEQAEMNDEQQTRVRVILQESAARHRERTLSAARLRRELAQAVRTSGTTDAEFMRIMQQIETMRAQEQQAWQADQQAIAEVLSPRQRAIFSLRWIEFQDRIRALMGARGRRARGTPGRPPG